MDIERIKTLSLKNLKLRAPFYMKLFEKGELGDIASLCQATDTPLGDLKIFFEQLDGEQAVAHKREDAENIALIIMKACFRAQLIGKGLLSMLQGVNENAETLGITVPEYNEFIRYFATEVLLELFPSDPNTVPPFPQ